MRSVFEKIEGPGELHLATVVIHVKMEQQGISKNRWLKFREIANALVISLSFLATFPANRSSNGLHDMFMSSTHGGALPRQRASPSGLSAATIDLGDLRHAALMKAMVVQKKTSSYIWYQI